MKFFISCYSNTIYCKINIQFEWVSCNLLYIVLNLFVLVSLILADENEYRLVRDLLINYDKRVRPSVHYSKPVNITYGVALAQIIDVVS